MDFPTTMVFDQNESSDYTTGDRTSRIGKPYSNVAAAGLYYPAVSKALNHKLRSISVQRPSLL